MTTPPNHAEPDDAALLARTAAGDEAAFTWFVDRHEGRLWRSLRLRSGNDADAEDAMQQTFLAAWRHAGAFRGSDARAWLATIARHALARLHRRSAALPLAAVTPAAATWQDDLQGAAEPDVDWCASGLEAGFATPSRIDSIARLELRDEIGVALAALSAEDREVLVLREFDGHAPAELAEILGIRLAAAKSRLHRARLRLCAELTRLQDPTAHG